MAKDEEENEVLKEGTRGRRRRGILWIGEGGVEGGQKVEEEKEVFKKETLQKAYGRAGVEGEER